MHTLTLFVLLVMAVGARAEDRQRAGAECTASDQCRQLALDAIAAGDYERAHDLAWRVVQTSPRRDRDPAALALLARAQSLSGRGYDALVMLQRLVAMKVVVDDVETSDDFRRVREYPQWSELREAMSRVRAVTVAADKPASAAVSVATVAADKPAPADKPGPAAVNATPDRPASPSASAAGVATADKPTVLEAPSAVAEAVLKLPASMVMPVALAYDAVSARFVLARADRDVLSVLSEASGNATNLVSDGWSGGAEITAIAIDRARGDLWVAGNLSGGGVLYHLQLISGRLLQKIPAPTNSGTSRFVAMTLGGNVVYLLDAEGRRTFTHQPRTRALQIHTKLPRDVDATGLSYRSGSLYVAHSAGLLRVDVASRSLQRVRASSAIDAGHLRSLAWHDGALFGIRQTSEPVIARLRFNGQGNTVTAVEVMAPASGIAGALSGDAYYYLSRLTDDTLALYKIPVGK